MGFIQPLRTIPIDEGSSSGPPSPDRPVSIFAAPARPLNKSWAHPARSGRRLQRRSNLLSQSDIYPPSCGIWLCRSAEYRWRRLPHLVHDAPTFFATVFPTLASVFGSAARRISLRRRRRSGPAFPGVPDSIHTSLRTAAAGFVFLFVHGNRFEFDRFDFQPIVCVGGEVDLVRADDDARGHRFKRGPG